MSDSFYEPTDHWSDSIESDNQSSMSVAERLVADPVSYEEMEECWLAYMDTDEDG
jgi:hypothetical protein